MLKENKRILMIILKAYRPRKDSKYYKLKQDLLINAQNFYNGREMIVNAFKNKIFLLSKPHYYPEYNSQKLKNEIKQLLYSLYRSKKLSTTIYNSLMNTI